MKRFIAAAVPVVLALTLFGCAADVSSGGRNTDTKPTTPEGLPPKENPKAGEKITLAAADVETVKGVALKDGKFTLGKEAPSIAASDIKFKAGRLGGHSPSVTLGDGAVSSVTLTAGDNAIKINVKGDKNFTQTSFTVTVHKNAASPSVPAVKITLAAADIETVKGVALKDGTFTLGKDASSIASSDIKFKADKLGGHMPEIQLGTGKLTDFQLKSGENTIPVTIKGDDYFNETSFSIVVEKSDDASPPPSSETITLKVEDIEKIFEKSAESGGTTFKIGNESVIKTADIKFKDSALKSKMPELKLSYKDKTQIVHTSHNGQLSLPVSQTTFNLHIDVSGDGFTPVRLDVTLVRETAPTPPPVTPPTPPVAPPSSAPFDGTLKAEHIDTIFGMHKQSDGKFKVPAEKMKMQRDDVVFKSEILNGHKPTYELWIDWGSGWEHTESGVFARDYINLPTDKADRNKTNFQIKVKKDSNFNKTEFTVNLTWE
ncbi:MAG: hypothetical protein ACTTKL_07065 [Treponema sp.]